ncbi:cell division protein FtsZ [Thermoplasma volcanium]|nr:cell division protein FtsZ [Thermoplasma volcanium]
MDNSNNSEEDIWTNDEKLQKIIEELNFRIKVFGFGGSGSNTINRLMRENLSGVKLIACNTDAAHLLRIRAHSKILLGKNLTRGLGAGADPSVGEMAAKESESEILKQIDETSIVFITAGLGGGTGTGAAPYVAKLAKDRGALTISFATLPFSTEGFVRMKNAYEGVRKLVKNSDAAVIIPNDKLIEKFNDVPVYKAFKFEDEVIATGIKGITDLIMSTGTINLDFNDLRKVMKDAGYSAIGMGSSSQAVNDRIVEALEKALDSPFMDVDISKAKGAIINVTGGRDLQLQEAQQAADILKKKIARDATIMWGTVVDESIRSSVKILVIVAGVKPNFKFEPGIEEVG